MEVSSEMIMCIVETILDKLPCTENFNQFKKNFEDLKGIKQDSEQPEDPKRKGLAKDKFLVKLQDDCELDPAKAPLVQPNSPTKALLNLADFLKKNSS